MNGFVCLFIGYQTLMYVSCIAMFQRTFYIDAQCLLSGRLYFSSDAVDFFFLSILFAKNQAINGEPMAAAGRERESSHLKLMK